MSWTPRILLAKFKDKSFIRFATVGALNTVLGLTLFPVLYWLVGKWVNVNIILTFTYIICPLFAFSMHRTVTFGSKGQVDAQGIKYLIVTVIMWGINVVLLNTMLHYTSLGPIIAQWIIAILLQLGNYFLFKHFVFRQINP